MLSEMSELQTRCPRGQCSEPQRRLWFQPRPTSHPQRLMHVPRPALDNNRSPLSTTACWNDHGPTARPCLYTPPLCSTHSHSAHTHLSPGPRARRAVLCRVRAGGGGRRPQASDAPPDDAVLRSNPHLGGNPYWWEELDDYYKDDHDYSLLTPDEVDDRVDDAAAFISVLEDLQPMPQQGHNAFAEVWTRLMRVPPSARVRVLRELEPGSLRGLWKASMSRYVLPDSLAMHLLGGFSVLEDFPDVPGEVSEYEGCAEFWRYVAPDDKFVQDRDMQSRYPRSAPWLKPNQGRYQASQKHFTQHFFLHPRTNALHSRLTLPLWGSIPNPFLPMYCRVRPGLVLTPLEADAGADMTFEYGPILARDEDAEGGPPPANTNSFRQDVQLAEDAREGEEEEEDPSGEGRQVTWEELLVGDLPVSGWPKPPADEMRLMSPFSGTRKDYVRVIAPGMYVGCAYQRDVHGNPDKEACVYFLLARKQR